MVVYHAEILTSLKAIAKAFGVPEGVVRQWEREGAPIVLVGQGKQLRYKAEKADLWDWFKVHKKSGQCTN